MANTFRNVLYEVTGTLAAAYTVPLNTTAIVIGCQAVNKSNTAAVSLDLELDGGYSAGGGIEEYLVYEVVIPQDASLAPIAGKLVMREGDVLRAKTGTTGDVGLVISILEIT